MQIQYIQVTVEPSWYVPAASSMGPLKELTVRVRTSDGRDHKITKSWEPEDFMTNFEYMMEYATRAIMRHIKKEKDDDAEV